MLGRACVDKRGLILADKWMVGNGGAGWNTDTWRISYGWTVPSTIPLAGADATLKMKATELTGGANARICPAIGLRGGFDMRVGGATQGQPVALGFCAQAGGTKRIRRR